MDMLARGQPLNEVIQYLRTRRMPSRVVVGNTSSNSLEQSNVKISPRHACPQTLSVLLFY